MSDFAVIDAVVAALLVATTGYCIVLTRRLKALKEGQASLQAALLAFDEATRRAAANLDRMEKTGLGMGRDLDGLVERGAGLVTELSVMVNAGDGVARRLEEAIDEVRAIGARRMRAEERG
ncbi:MAG: DUF6468 domain-containing protein [Pseudomonadota bacterium]|nr:DUF6468 domain-containing protein [Pseudomonadota bacterium]